MVDSSQDNAQSSGNGFEIQWGTVLAGAAIAVGAVILAPVIMDKLGGEKGTAELGIKAWLEGSFTKIGAFIQEKVSSAMVGAGLIGTGVGLAMCHNSEKEVNSYINNVAGGGFAEREQARIDVAAIQGMMKARQQMFQQAGIPVEATGRSI